LYFEYEDQLKELELIGKNDEDENNVQSIEMMRRDLQEEKENKIDHLDMNAIIKLKGLVIDNRDKNVALTREINQANKDFVKRVKELSEAII